MALLPPSFPPPIGFSTGADPPVHVWDEHSLQPLAVLRGAHSGGVSALAFSPANEGALLASCDLAPSPLIALWDWRKGVLLASARAGAGRVLGLAFSPRGALVSHGHGALRFWSADGAKLVSRRGLFGGALTDDGGAPSRSSASRTITCVAFSSDGGVALAGTADGCLQQWDSHGRCEDSISINRQQPLFAIHVSDAVGVLAAGKGGRVLWW